MKQMQNFAFQGPRLHKLSVPVRLKDGIVRKSLSVIRPSDWFKYLVSRPQWFRKVLLGRASATDRAVFWKLARKVPEWQCVLPELGEEHKAIPFKIYGDKGPYFKKRSLQLFSISSLFSHSGDSFETRLIL